MRSRDVVINDSNAVVAASQTTQQVSKIFGLGSIEHSLFFKVRAKVNTTTVTNAITMILQHKIHDDDTWATAGSVSITADGVFEIAFNNEASQTNLPLLPICRVVCTTGVDDTTTFSNIWITVA